ncbi:MAG: hypothetical protein JWN48_5599, partial [Myxococcaceae bacterium]|nr:hypothetical protein [Myxococcaceae bacterium]
MSYGLSRRGILQSAGAAAFAATLAEWASACVRPAMNSSAGGGSGGSGERTSGSSLSVASAPEPEALPRDKRIGFALVGIGKL